jgi:hypothetical protein
MRLTVYNTGMMIVDEARAPSPEARTNTPRARLELTEFAKWDVGGREGRGTGYSAGWAGIVAWVWRLCGGLRTILYRNGSPYRKSCGTCYCGKSGQMWYAQLRARPMIYEDMLNDNDAVILLAESDT